MKVIHNILVGKKDVKLTAPSHVAGVHEGNHPTKRKKKAHAAGEGEDPVAEGRSTGINPKHHAPIHPAMPQLSAP